MSKNRERILVVLAIVLALATFACGSPTALPVFTTTPEAGVESTEAPEPTATLEPTDTPEPTEIPEELEEQVTQLYGVVVLIQADAVLLNEAAERTAAGDLAGAEQFGLLIGLGAVVQAVDETIPEIDPPGPLAGAWEDAVAVHEQTKDIFGRWLDEEIVSTQVVEEMEPVLEEAERVSLAVEGIMAGAYGADAGELAENRHEAIDEMVAGIFEGEVPPLAKGTEGLEVRGGRMYVSYDYLHVVGDVTNTTDDAYEYVKVVATFYDADGEMLGADYTYTEMDIVPPHGVGVFNLSGDVGGAATDVATYTLQVEGSVTGDRPYAGLVVTAGRMYEEYGYSHLVGEVENTGESNCDYVKIVAGFYDAEGTVVAVDYTYAELDIVLAGDKSPFELSVEDLPAFDHYELWVEGEPTSEEPYGDFEVDVAREYEQYGYYYLAGEVKNTGEKDCEFVKIVVAFYDAEGQVIAVDYTYTELDVVPANGASPFELAVDNLPAFDHYELWVEGSPI